jgi:hypothetical protein
MILKKTLTIIDIIDHLRQMNGNPFNGSGTRPKGRPGRKIICFVGFNK